jgi:cbb3-type cytochrome oxidase subunit 3
MSDPAAVTITPRHYQTLCGLALAAIFLLQIQQNIVFFVNVFMLAAGVLAILNWFRVGPVAVLATFAAGQLFDQFQQDEFYPPETHRLRPLNLTTLLLSVAVLTFIIGLYRLHGLWFGVLPRDPRQQSLAAQARSAESLTPAELAALLVPIPLCALLADVAGYMLRQHWTLVGLPPRWKQFLTIVWFVLLVVFVSAHAFRYWRRLQMDRAAAQLLLQDLLWNETRGEQRRLNRWIVWRKLKETRGDS